MATLYRTFFTAFQQSGGIIDELVLDPEVWMYTWVISLNRPDPGCAAARYGAIQRDPRFSAIQATLLARGFVPFAPLESPNWLNLSLALDISNATMLRNMHVWNSLTLELTCKYFDAATFEPLRKLFPAVRASNYQAFVWGKAPEHECIPSMNGFAYCDSGEGAITGTLASRDFYNCEGIAGMCM